MVELSRVPFSVSVFSEACMEDADPTAVTEVTVVCSGQRERERVHVSAYKRMCVCCLRVCLCDNVCVCVCTYVCVCVMK